MADLKNETSMENAKKRKHAKSMFIYVDFPKSQIWTRREKCRKIRYLQGGLARKNELAKSYSHI